MKVVIADSYGGPEVLHIVNAPSPSIGANDILVRVKAFAVTAADSRIRGARFPRGFGFLARLFFGLRKPRIKILGSTYSGVVEQVGSSHTQFEVGDEVCGMTGAKMGTYAEFIKVTKFKSITKKPSTVSHEDAAGLLFGGTAALYFIRDKLLVKKNDTVVINGASGAVGTNAVQLAKYYGGKVTGVTSTSNEKLVRELGASYILDYTKQDLVTSGQKFEVLLDTVGNISSTTAEKLLTKNGRAGLMVAGLYETLRSRGPVKTGTSTERKDDIDFLLKLTEQGELKVVIDRVYELNRIADAHNYVDAGKKVGNVIVRL